MDHNFCHLSAIQPQSVSWRQRSFGPCARLLIAAGMFVAGGCGSSSNRASAPASAAAGGWSDEPGIAMGSAGTADLTWASPARGLEDYNSAAEPEAPKTVNVFGEFNGQQREVSRNAAESGLQQHTWSDEGFDADVAIESAGKWMAFASTRHSERTHLYLQRVDGVSVVQLTDGAGDDAHPCFSPDGKQIAFASTRAGSWDLYVTDLDGRNVMQITAGPAQDLHPSFSPDGRRLVYSSLSPRGEQWEIWTIDLTTSEKRMVCNGLFPVWSPDKTHDRIAFQRARQRGSRWFSVWTVDLDNGEPRRMTEVAVSNNAAVITPAWSPNGQKLAFATVLDPGRGAGEKDAKSTKAAGRYDVWAINADGTGRQRLTDGAGSNVSPVWSTAQRIFFISDRGGVENVWSVRANPGAAGAVAAKPEAAKPTESAGVKIESTPTAESAAAETRETIH